jgi:hypothetical protein
MYTIFSVVQRQQRKSDVMTSFGLTACSTVYYQVPHCTFLIIASSQYFWLLILANFVGKNCGKDLLTLRENQ